MYEKATRGTCFGMCPKEEKEMRKKTNRVHKLERLCYSSERKWSDGWMVKEYRRSAAGRDIHPGDLRTSATLLTTTLHLINRVLTSAGSSFLDKYFFIFERLRAIRQDASIQCLHDTNTILTLLITIRFLIYASYRLCTDCNFDDTINNTLLNECILTAINLLGEKVSRGGQSGADGGLDDLVNKLDSINIFKETKGSGRNNTCDTVDHQNYQIGTNCEKKFDDSHGDSHDRVVGGDDDDTLVILSEVLSYHVLNNLQSPHAVVEALRWRRRSLDACLHTAIQIWMQHSIHNYHRTLKLSLELPVLHKCLFNKHLANIQSSYLERLTRAFSTRNNHHHLPHLSTILQLPHPDTPNNHPIDHHSTDPSHNSSAHILLSFQGVTINDNKVFFDRKSFNPPHPLSTTTNPTINRLLEPHMNNLPSLLIPNIKL